MVKGSSVVYDDGDSEPTVAAVVKVCEGTMDVGSPSREGSNPKLFPKDMLKALEAENGGVKSSVEKSNEVIVEAGETSAGGGNRGFARESVSIGLG